jgi:hypothetical protein
MDPDQATDPTPDPTPLKGVLSSVTLRMQEKYFNIFFSYKLPAGTLSSVLKFFFIFC